jgi:hypothetical protein
VGLNNQLASLQYTAAPNPVSQTTPAVLSAITSPASANVGSADTQAEQAPQPQPQQQQLAAVNHATAAAVQQHPALQGLTYPYHMAGLPAAAGTLDLASMYSLPHAAAAAAGMYTL